MLTEEHCYIGSNGRSGTQEGDDGAKLKSKCKKEKLLKTMRCHALMSGFSNERTQQFKDDASTLIVVSQRSGDILLSSLAA